MPAAKAGDTYHYIRRLTGWPDFGGHTMGSKPLSYRLLDGVFFTGVTFDGHELAQQCGHFG
jgi:hypothetical protein